MTSVRSSYTSHEPRIIVCSLIKKAVFSQNEFWDTRCLIFNSIDSILGEFHSCGNNAKQTSSELKFNKAEIQNDNWKETVFEIFLLKYWSLQLLYKPHN